MAARSPTKSPTATLSAGLVDACDRSDLFGVQLTPEQHALLAAVEAGCLLHVWRSAEGRARR